MKSGIKMMGHLQIWDDDAPRVTPLVDVHNIITCGGCAFMAGHLSGGAMTDMGWMAVGQAATSAAAITGNTTLETEIVDGDRHVPDISAPTTTSVLFSAKYAAGHHTGKWVEAGVLNAVAVGTLLCRAVFTDLNKAAGDSFIVEYTISFADDAV